MNVKPEYDVLIAGGGMVGASMALAIANLGLNIAVVEPTPVRSGSQPSYDERVTAFSAGSRRILEQMALWPALAGHATPIEHIHVSERGRFGFSRLHAADEGVEALGYIIPNRVFGMALHAAIGERGGISMLCPARVEDVTIEPAWAEVRLADDEGETRTRAKLLIVADGARSPLRERLGIHAAVHDYRQTAIIANVTPSEHHGYWAYERFTSQGPVAMLPMSEGRVGAVWTVASEAADTAVALDDERFLHNLQALFGWRLGRFERAGKRFAYPLQMLQAERQIGPRAAIIGNAAHSLHPVAGQSFNLSLRDVATLAEVVGDALSRGEDPGAIAALQRYAARRNRDQRLTVGLTDGLMRLFAPHFRPLAHARNLGLVGFDLLPGAKRPFARQTMGLAGRVPRVPTGKAR
ncbi:MAG TPA: 2-octaprenyl-6-methoxyphenyl hydroxylase [Gammaproteobacteria bacterium]|nr:2-octaprenyl-6-methoxyphenyl hydroxylase [Gammaproteobacteria bacterium]